MPEELLYLDPWSGVSGDMLLAALLDAGGVDLEAVLLRAVASLGLRGVSVDVARDAEWGLACTRVRVQAEESPPLRHLQEMLRIIDRATLTDRVKCHARAALTRLAEVEADIHGCTTDQIHFHEVGAADTLVDVVGTFVLVEALGIDRTFVGTIPVGGGTVEIAHGRMGVPAPATAALLAGYQVAGGPEPGELTTPTGALLVCQLGARQGVLPPMIVKAVGYGAGAMKLKHGPNVLRVVIGTCEDDVAASGDPSAALGGLQAAERVVELQTNIDNVSPEIIGHAVRRLRDIGVLDVWTVDAQMKKDRPGTILHVLVRPSEEAVAVALLFAETGTLGVRRQSHTRYVADRGLVTVTVADRPVRVKWGRWAGELVSLAPEHDDAAAAAAAAGLPLRAVMQQAVERARGLLDDPR